jgi:UDP-glucose:(heptosyl)LPS alpha-1,3-glucosyltransferase
MKIALAHKRLELRGGTERVLYRTAEGLRDRGHEVHLFCHEFRIPVPRGVWGHQVPGIARPRSARALMFALLAPRVIAKHACDVVLSFDRILSQDIFRSSEGPRKVLLEKLKNHSGMLRKIWYSISLYHQLLVGIEKLQVQGNRSGKLIANSEQTKQEFIEVYGIPEDQIVVIHNGVDSVRFNPRRRLKEGKKLREDLGIPRRAPVVLFVGTGFRRKGLSRLLELWERRELPGVYLLVVGNDARLPRYRKRWSGEKEVIFAGRQENVEDYYACANLLVLPAIREAFGNVVLEAMASGLPVIISGDVGAAAGVKGPLSEGILSNPNDSAELKDKILRMLERERWASLAREARLAAEKYNWENYLDRVEQTLLECCGQHFPAKDRAATASGAGAF